MNIDDMPAGPELDRLIAERVMGWTWGSNDFAAGADVFGDWQEARTVHGPIVKPGGWCVRGDWRPSTDIAHAWEVLEAASKLGHSTRISRYRGNWMANIGEQMMNEVAETAPLAICRAVLRAIHA